MTVYSGPVVEMAVNQFNVIDGAFDKIRSRVDVVAKSAGQIIQSHDPAVHFVQRVANMRPHEPGRASYENICFHE